MKKSEGEKTNNVKDVVSTELGNLMGQLQQILIPQDSEEGNLAKSWRYLQVYSRWGQRLPNTDAELKGVLKITEAMPNPFYTMMLDGYIEINAASSFFERDILTKVDDLNKSLLRYAEKGKEGQYELIVELLDLAKKSEDKEEALTAVMDLIKELQDQAIKNEAEAVNVKNLLFEYSQKLGTAVGTIDLAQKAVEADDEVSKSRIDKLKGSADIDGSIAALKAIMDNSQKEYERNVVIASTTPTYGWVPFVGWLSASIVAGIYGDKAIKELKKLKEYKGQWEAANKELIKVLNIHSTQSLANEGLTKALRFTESAITNTQTVKEAWSNLTSNLKTILEKVQAMTKENVDSELELKASVIIKNYAKTAAKKWNEIQPIIKAMNDQFYIKFEDGDKSIDSLIAEIEMKMEDPVSQN